MINTSEFWIEVNQARYDELLRKEALLDTIEKLHGRMTEYVFRDAVGYLLQSSGNNDEQNT